jgi:hypothetical protein
MEAGGDVSTCIQFIGFADELVRISRSLIESDVSIPKSMQNLLEGINRIRSSVQRRIVQHYAAG